MGQAKCFGAWSILQGRLKGDDPEIHTVQNPKRLDGRLALLRNIRKTFTDSILMLEKSEGITYLMLIDPFNYHILGNSWHLSV